MNKSICLMGNPNSGKTTLFNALTGSYQMVGNWTGVTTEAKSGHLKNNKDITIVDLPGIYSLMSMTSDEKAVIDYLKQTPPQVIINVLDGTNLERNLYLSLELASLNIPMVLAVNFSDDLKKNGITLNEEGLKSLLGLPVVSISALKKTNVNKLIETAINFSSLPKKIFSFGTNPEQLYSFLRENVPKIINKVQTNPEKFTLKADKLLLGRITGLPIFCLVIFSVYYLSIKIGGGLGEKLKVLLDSFTLLTKQSLLKVNAKPWIISLICDGIYKGFSSVFCFLPQLLILFSLMTILEESGYMARCAFIFDGILKRVGLGGKSIIPLIISCGCSVTGIMASRNIDDENEKLMTIVLAPLMPCGAKSAVFVYIASIFFNKNAFVATSMYFVSIFSIIFLGMLLKRFKPFNNKNGSFILELPTLRFPSLKDIVMALIEKIKDFCIKVGTVIFTISVLIWLLSNFGFKGYANGDIALSFLFYLGNILKYVFYPLGFCSWETAVSIICGIFAKEGIVEGLNMLSVNVNTLFSNNLTVYAFMCFILLMPPCISTLIVAKKQLKNTKKFIFMILTQFLYAYAVAFIVNGLGRIIFISNGLILSCIIAIIILLLFLFCVKRLIINKCGNCHGKRRCSKCQDVHNTTI
ncbi:MAG: ferrous iron transporter B [Clostridia bacterium]|nr:ferrous iron transporter B [Clostridia bacterium]